MANTVASRVGVALVACLLCMSIRCDVVNQNIEVIRHAIDVVCPRNQDVFSMHDEMKQLTGGEPFKKRAEGYQNVHVLSTIAKYLKTGYENTLLSAIVNDMEKDQRNNIAVTKLKHLDNGYGNKLLSTIVNILEKDLINNISTMLKHLEKGQRKNIGSTTLKHLDKGYGNSISTILKHMDNGNINNMTSTIVKHLDRDYENNIASTMMKHLDKTVSPMLKHLDKGHRKNMASGILQYMDKRYEKIVSGILKHLEKGYDNDFRSNDAYDKITNKDMADKRAGQVFDENAEQISKYKTRGIPASKPALPITSLDLDLPWSCRCKPQLFDLGNHVVPRYISGAVCANERCFYGHYQCLPIQRAETVLVMHYGLCIDKRLPANLGEKYMLQDLSVQVGCQCGEP